MRPTIDQYDDGYALFFVAPADLAPVQLDHFTGSDVAQIIRQTAALQSADLFLPAAWHSPVFNDGPAPGFVLQLCARDVEPLIHLQSELGETVVPNVGSLSALAVSGVFVARSWPVAGQTAPAARTAPLSFLVRYFSAGVLDADAFRAAYQASHPAILGRFPAIRNVRCYVPHSHNATCIELLNEVVFDDTSALAAALKSDVLQALRDDTATLPERGDNAHHALCRHSLIAGRFESPALDGQ